MKDSNSILTLAELIYYIKTYKYINAKSKYCF